MEETHNMMNAITQDMLVSQTVRDSALGQPLRMACSLPFLQRERGTHHLSRGLTGLFQSCCCNHCEWSNHTIRCTQSRKRCSLSKPTPDIRPSRANLHHSFSNNMFSEIMYLGERCRDCACTIPRSELGTSLQRPPNSL